MISPHYSFTEPIIIPCTKYFCKNGYAHRIGTTAATTAVDCVARAVIFTVPARSWLEELDCVRFIMDIIQYAIGLRLFSFT